MLIKDKIILKEDIEHIDDLLADDLNPVDNFLIKRELHALKSVEQIHNSHRINGNTRDEVNAHASQNWEAATACEKVT